MPVCPASSRESSSFTAEALRPDTRCEGMGIVGQRFFETQIALVREMKEPFEN